MIKATWKAGFAGLHKADAQKVAEEILSIGQDVTPAQIVDRARDETSELHKCFTWDNEKAADKWRAHEARQIVCHLVIQRPEAKPDAPEVRLFYKGEVGEGYKPSPMIFRREEEYYKVMNRALTELKAFQAKYSFLADLKEMQDLLDAVEASIQAA